MVEKARFSFSLGKRIGLGFTTLILLVIVALAITYRTLDYSVKLNEKITKINTPSLSSLEELKLFTYQAKMLILAWVNFQSGQDHIDKRKYSRLIKVSYPNIKKRILYLSKHWTKKERTKIAHIFDLMTDLLKSHAEVTMSLNKFQAYEDPEKKFLADFMTEKDGPIDILNEKIMAELDHLINNKNEFFRFSIHEMLDSFNFLKSLFKYLGLLLIVGGIAISIITTRSIVNPIDKLRSTLLEVSKGIFSNPVIDIRNDEIGQMTLALNKVVMGLKRTKDFAQRVGSGDFKATYTPLSDEDDLGHALLFMRDDLAASEKELEMKVEQRTEEVVAQKNEIEKQNDKIQNLYNELTSSIRYAQRIQEAVFPKDYVIEGIDSFILFKPKDIVSGDFYWLGEKKNYIYFAAVDCTGHGVPGAFMSIMGNSGLNEALANYSDTSEILNFLNFQVSNSLSTGDAKSSMKDGMDMVLCRYDKKNKKLQFSGANNPIFLFRDGEINKYRTQKMAIGSYYLDSEFKYKNEVIDLEKGDIIYLFSDGYADQFGGPKNKKFMYKRFRELLKKISSLKMSEQKEILNNTIVSWMAESNINQIDDILVMGFKVN